MTLFLLFWPQEGWTLFTGNGQYDRTQLNTENLLDNEYFINLLSYEPFWKPDPASRSPLSYIRNSEGSLNKDQFYIVRQVRVRGMTGKRSFWGYNLQQKEDFEQTYFYQSFEAEIPITGPLSLRIFGQPTAKKQDSDLGFGGVLYFSSSSFKVEGTFVDFNFNGKNQDNQSDRRKLYNLLAQMNARRSAWSSETTFEWESPVEREFHSEGIIFGHKKLAVENRTRYKNFSFESYWHKEHRFTNSVSSSTSLEDFRKETFKIRAEGSFHIWDRFGHAGIQFQRRRAEFTEGSTFLRRTDLNRWEINPYFNIESSFSHRFVPKIGFFSALVWHRNNITPDQQIKDFSFHSKLNTSLQINFTPNITLEIMPTWDLDQLFTSRSFDGGNVQFRAQIP